MRPKWHKIGYFRSEDSARMLVPNFFSDAGYEGHFTQEGDKDVLWVNYEYWLSTFLSKELL